MTATIIALASVAVTSIFFIAWGLRKRAIYRRSEESFLNRWAELIGVVERKDGETIADLRERLRAAWRAPVAVWDTEHSYMQAYGDDGDAKVVTIKKGTSVGKSEAVVL